MTLSFPTVGSNAFTTWFGDAPIKGFAILVLAAWFIYQIGAGVYNVFFHPLKSHPGPLAARASPFPIAYHLLKGDIHLWHMYLHQTYGPIVRSSPNVLSFTDASAWKDIHGFRKPGESHYLKDPAAYVNLPNNVPSILSADDANHTRYRRIFSHAFSDKALREQQPLFKKSIDLLVGKLTDVAEADPKHNKVNMIDYLNYTTFDIMGDLTFGEPMGLLENNQYNAWVKILLGSLKLLNYLRAAKFVFPGLIDLVRAMMPASLARKLAEMEQYAIDQVDRRLARKVERPDIWHLVIKQEGEKALTPQEMHSNAVVFIGAGSETTSTALSGLLYLLMSNPDKMKTLVSEVRGAFETEDDLNIPGLARLPYLFACIEEGLRRYPTIPGTLSRIVPKEGSMISGVFVPSGTIVSISSYTSLLSPSHWHNPTAFLPERWLPNAGPEFANDNKASFNPFSTGPRNCLGKNMAYHEMRLILASLLWHFDFSLYDESRDWDQQKVYILWNRKPLMVRLKTVRR